MEQPTPNDESNLEQKSDSWEKEKSLLESSKETISNTVNTGVEKVKWIWQAGIEWVKSAASQWIESAKDTFNQGKETLKDSWQNAIEWIKWVWKELKEWIWNTIS